MTRIEMSLYEYEGMKSKIKNLEGYVVALEKKANLYKSKYENLFNLLDEIGDMPILPRIFGWKSVLKKINNFRLNG